MSFMEHDMDELFRRAALNYPLKEMDTEWNSIADQIAVIRESSWKALRKKFIGLLLIVPLLIADFDFLDFQHEDNRFSNSDMKLNRTDVPLKATGEMHRAAELGVDQLLPGSPIPFEGSKSSIKGQQNVNPPPKSRTEKQPHLNQLPISRNTQHANHFVDKESHEIKSRTGLQLEQLYRQPSIAMSARLEKNPYEIALKFSPVTTRRISDKPGWYLGISGGIELTKVKDQAGKAGHSLGLLAGYRFGKISIESGSMWSRKRYYTEGKHFSMDKVGPSMPSGMEIMKVQGQFRLIEIPFRIKYDVVQYPKSNIFLTTGISSSILVEERNSYLIKFNGLMEHHKGLYKDVSFSPFCSATMGVGLERTISNTSWRIEPYLKIPIDKVGMGAMPVLSFGLSASAYSILKD